MKKLILITITITALLAIAYFSFKPNNEQWVKNMPYYTIDHSNIDTFSVYLVRRKIEVTPEFRLYIALLEDGHTTNNLGSFNSFKSALHDKEQATNIYLNLLKVGYSDMQLGSLTEFLKVFNK
jgi:hypothetical protein